MFVLIFPAIIILVAALGLYYGIVFMLLWNWFSTTMGLPAIGLAQAYGFMLTVNLLKDVQRKDKTAVYDSTSEITSILTKPAVALAIGYLIKVFFLNG
jgi:hypothetical protein